MAKKVLKNEIPENDDFLSSMLKTPSSASGAGDKNKASDGAVVDFSTLKKTAPSRVSGAEKEKPPVQVGKPKVEKKETVKKVKETTEEGTAERVSKPKAVKGDKASTEALSKLIAQKTGMQLTVVNTIIQLLDEGNTVPFIARYRKELTEGATDEQLRDFHDMYMYTKNLEERKLDVIRLIDEKGLMTPELQAEIMAALTLARVEDLYRPFKEKKNTKATIAKAKGLEPLAKILAKCDLSKEAFEAEATKYVIDTGDVKTSVKSVEEAIGGAKDIIAEDVSDHATLREEVRSFGENRALLTTKTTKTFEENGVYKIYGNYSKQLNEMPSYAYLAVSRAEDEKQLGVTINFPMDTMAERAGKYFVPKNSQSSVEFVREAIKDGLTRLLLPSVEREVRSNKKRRADEAAIKIFGENLKQLLLTAPLRGKVVLGFDPAFRTGCKLAVVDATGKFLYNTVIYPTEPQNKVAEAELVLNDIIKKYGIEVIVVGNGTASRESSQFLANFLKKYTLDVKYMVVSEAGASVYSASKLAQEEYPDLDVTVRGAISIGHRVQDPLAELTKIDPKAIGVGQYQHDVDQKLLLQKLDEKVEDVVNSVGVNVNTASYPLLQYIAGLTPAIAKNIVAYRDENGEFTSKAQLKKAKGLGPKAYEQCIGFLRIVGGKEPLDATGIHPEMYDKVYALLDKEFSLKKKEVKLPLSNLTVNDGLLKQWSQNYEIGFETLSDIVKELQRPGMDPRDDMDPPSFASDIMDIKDLKIGMVLDGVVRNITDFGAFVDIGLHNDGLVHKSQMADRFVATPMDVVTLGQKVRVRVLEIDAVREKVSLSMKELSNTIPKDKVEAKNEARKTEKKDNEESGESAIKGNIVWR